MAWLKINIKYGENFQCTKCIFFCLLPDGTTTRFFKGKRRDKIMAQNKKDYFIYQSLLLLMIQQNDSIYSVHHHKLQRMWI